MGTDPLGKSSSRQTSQSRDVLLVSFATYVVLNEALHLGVWLPAFQVETHSGSVDASCMGEEVIPCGTNFTLSKEEIHFR